MTTDSEIKSQDEIVVEEDGARENELLRQAQSSWDLADYCETSAYAIELYLRSIAFSNQLGVECEVHVGPLGETCLALRSLRKPSADDCMRAAQRESEALNVEFRP